jgi:hypothetical protein
LHTLELCGTIININKASNAFWALGFSMNKIFSPDLTPPFD